MDYESTALTAELRARSVYANTILSEEGRDRIEGMTSQAEFIYGTAWKEERTAGLVEMAIRVGFRGIDTANQRRHYFEAGGGEGLAGAYRAGVGRRADLFL